MPLQTPTALTCSPSPLRLRATLTSRLRTTPSRSPLRVPRTRTMFSRASRSGSTVRRLLRQPRSLVAAQPRITSSRMWITPFPQARRLKRSSRQTSSRLPTHSTRATPSPSLSTRTLTTSPLVSRSWMRRAATSSTVGNITLTENEDTDITFTVSRTNTTGADNNGLFQLLLKAIAWNTADTWGAYNIYNFNLDDFKTGTVSLD